jgi:hypothetical protein
MHEPCLYADTLNRQRVLFFRQVDDFTVAAQHQETSKQLIALINSKMQIEIKDLGIIT